MLRGYVRQRHAKTHGRPRPVRMTREERVRQFRLLLQAEPSLTRAELARRVGVSRVLVTKVIGPIAK